MNKIIKKTLSLLLTAVMAFAALSISGIELFMQANAAGVDFLTFELNNDNTEYGVSTCGTAAMGELIIPETYEGKPVTKICAEAFYNCISLKSITIPESVTEIDPKAFEYCKALESINIPAGVTSISESTFSSCSHLRSVSFTEGSKLTSIGDNAFIYCIELSSIVIPKGVTSIGFAAFETCDQILHVYYGSDESDREKIAIGSNNSKFLEADWKYTARATGITVSPTSKALAVGATQQLTATVVPEDAVNKKVTWASSDTAIATVDENGLVNAKAVGTATITVTTEDRNKTASCAVSVVVPVTGVTLDVTSKTLTVGTTQQLTATVAPDNATNKAVTWESSNTEIATVDENGLVSAEAAGTATITVTTEDGGKTASCAITVEPAENELVKIDVLTQPNTLEYTYKKGSFDKTGLSIKATYSNGDTETITDTSEINVTGFNPNQTGEQKLTVEYGDKYAEQKITVNVKYSCWQWLIIIFLFGCIWY